MPSIKKLFVDAGSMLGSLTFRAYYKGFDIFSTGWAWVSNITTEANSVNTTMPKNIHTEGSGNQISVKNEDVLESMRFLELKNFKEYLGDDYVRSIVAFSEASQAAQRMSSDVRRKHALNSLLTAVACGDEDLARKIVTSRPELLLDLSAIVTDISGKEIKELTPLQAAICAGDVDMLQMIKEVLHQKLQNGVTLNFEPELEIQRQFKIIYPNGVDSEETEQQVKAQEFKTSKLNHIFTAINTATVVQVKFELNTPGANNTDSPLNTALHNFRKQFAATSNLEQIFNPFYLLNAFEFYDEQFDNFNGNENDKCDRRNLFWRQVVGYIQRHLPACYLQAFAQGMYNIVEDREKLRRDFEFRYDKGSYLRVLVGDLNNLGYKYAARPWGGGEYGGVILFDLAFFQKLLRTKKSGLENLFTRRAAGNYSYLPTRCVIA